MHIRGQALGRNTAEMSVVGSTTTVTANKPNAGRGRVNAVRRIHLDAMTHQAVGSATLPTAESNQGGCTIVTERAASFPVRVKKIGNGKGRNADDDRRAEVLVRLVSITTTV